MNHNSIKNALRMKNNVQRTLCQKLSFDPAGQIMKVGYIFEGIFEVRWKNFCLPLHTSWIEADW